MRFRIAASTVASLAIAGCAVAQGPRAAEDHSAHHPAASSAAAPAQRPGVAPDAFDRQMRAMQDMHQRMQSARTPAERAALMDEHMKLMESGMAMMGQMRGMGAMPGPGTMGGSGQQGGMGMHQQMEHRMAMMEQMMRMMLDREAAMPRK